MENEELLEEVKEESILDKEVSQLTEEDKQKLKDEYLKIWTRMHTPWKKDIDVGRNEPCPCGSGKKYKKCCGKEIKTTYNGGDIEL